MDKAFKKTKPAGKEAEAWEALPGKKQNPRPHKRRALNKWRRHWRDSEDLPDDIFAG